MTAADMLKQGMDGLGIASTASVLEKYLSYCALLEKWNKVHNLTAIKNPLHIVSNHILDSLAVLPHLPDGSVADIGSGAGLPGIPIAIADPRRSVTLNDSNGKRIAFLRQASIELGLGNVQVEHSRVEDWKPAKKFVVVISRGFSALRSFLGGCRHLVAPNGVLAAMKGVFPDKELEVVPDSFDCGTVVRLRVPFLEAQRHLVLCRMMTQE